MKDCRPSPAKQLISVLIGQFFERSPFNSAVIQIAQMSDRAYYGHVAVNTAVPTMLNIATHFLLILTILYCPLQCQGGACCSAHPVAATGDGDSGCTDCEHCCRGRSADASDHSQHRPAAPCDEHSPASKCQCICAGAVITKTDDGLAVAAVCPLSIAVGITAVQTGEVFECRVVETLPHHGRATPGRIVRVLHMSFLC